TSGRYARSGVAEESPNETTGAPNGERRGSVSRPVPGLLGRPPEPQNPDPGELPGPRRLVPAHPDPAAPLRTAPRQGHPGAAAGPAHRELRRLRGTGRPAHAAGSVRPLRPGAPPGPPSPGRRRRRPSPPGRRARRLLADPG